VDAACVWRLEEVVDLYAEPYDARFAIGCFDQCPSHLVGEVRAPLPATPREPQRYDSQYQRNGTCNLLMFFAPQDGWRHVSVTERRTKQDFAHQRRDLVDGYSPEAEKLRLVVDNLNTHTPAAL
jgi:DDE superfamily endonuclease